MIAPTAVVVDPYSSGVMIAPELRRGGLRPVAVQGLPLPADVFVHTLCPEDFEMLLPPSGDVGALTEELRPLAPVVVLPGWESGVLLADAIAAALTPDLANVPELSLARRHKGRMTAAVAAAGLPVASTVCARDPDEVRNWLESAGLSGADLVIKPALGAGTEGVSLAPGGVGWEAAMAAVSGRTNLMGVVDEEVIVQERLRGVEYIVDTFSFGGRHTVNAVCRYHKVSNGGHFAV